MNQEKRKYEIPHLLVRELQAPLVSELIKGFAKDIGEDNALKIVKKVIEKDAVLSGKNLAVEVSGNSLEDLLKVVKEIWAKDGVMEIENISLNKKTLSFDVTRCGYAEMYQRMDILELGNLMSCSRDFAFMDGFNPEFELKRTKTIMEGDRVCDFRYVRKSKDI
ncbi:MAG: L-2-amino-thiazoline-4-carboxylic acid hydrolase [Candidatus Hodarchaeales archaeon]